MKTALLLLALFLAAQSPRVPTRVSPPFANIRGAFFAVSVADVDASSRWYQDKLGLQIDKRETTPDVAVCILSGNGLLVELIQQRNSLPLSQAAPAARNPVELQGIFKTGLIVDDVDAVFRELKARKVEIAFGMFPARPDSPYKNFAVRDNSGNLIQFFGK